jgi:RHS repeat-associated protein
VWRWDQQEPFGNNPADENPSGLGAFDLPLRLPGQYFDKETNLHYNYFRDYDPSLGIYKQSDPVGLRAGLNTYAYVRATPLLLTDPTGEQASNGGKCVTAECAAGLPPTAQPSGCMRDCLKTRMFVCGITWRFRRSRCWARMPGWIVRNLSNQMLWL